MTRLYIQPSFLNSCEEHGLWSGGNDQYRGDRSVDFSTFDKNGRARVEAFSDAALEANKEKRKTSIPLTDRILPQAKRVNLLTEQMRELEVEYKSGKMTIQDYTLYRNILSVKRSRAEVLLKKAVSVRPIPHEDDEYADEMPEVEAIYCARNADHHSSDTGIAGSSYPSWINDISNENSLKNFLKIACKVVRKAVQLSQAARNYYLTLKAL